MSHSLRTSRWIQKLGTQHGDRPRLLCLPHAGGSGSFYHPLSVHLGATVDVFAVQYPGRQERRIEPPLVTIDELAERIHAELTTWTDRPLVLFGHSMGAVIGYEVGRLLQRDGIPPAGLIVSGRRAPSVHVEESLHRRGDQALIAEVRQLSGTAAALLDDAELLEMILPALRADYRAIETYRHRPGRELDCPVTALVGEDDHRASVDHVRAWQGHTTGAFDLRTFPGGHFYLNNRWPDVAAAIRGAVTSFTAPVLP
ncbi:alpha/beta fold hydrolase [Micromonospora sp. NPDC049171]|uniref:thioesterase II family protein n=1 Tax=Micromonospora sp. NPDC049171 TaxID=3155770 RepID=UPI0033DC12F5